ncbi:MAG TPA: hypothetical protein VKQ54_06675 [Caulobacteraceae bacterium]|nr:hypothetical protein [Caulobacteraceae bacterium]
MALIATVQLFCLGLFASGVQAKPVKVEYQDLKITYTAAVAGTAADNIYLVLQDAKKDPLSKFKVTVSATGFNVSGNSDSFTLTPKMGTIADMSTVTLRIKSVANYNGKIGLQSATFRSGTTVTGAGDVTGGALMGDPQYIMSLDVIGSPALTVEDLTFYENHPSVSFDTLDPSVPIDTTGIAEPDANLSGAGASDAFSVPPIDNNAYFIAQGEVFDQGGSQPIAWFVDGYTPASNVPEPPIGALLILPLLGLVWNDFRGRSRAT